jgi:glycogen(starch) synthase
VEVRRQAQALMHLLLVNYEFPPIGGGAATATQALGRAFVSLGHEVTVLTSGIGDRTGVSQEDSMRVIRLDTGRKRMDRATQKEMLSFLWHGMRGLASVCGSQRPGAAIVFFSIPCGPIGWLLGARHRVPYVLSLRGGDVPGFLPELDFSHALLAPIRRASLRRARAVVANSPSLAQLARQADGGEVFVIPNGVDTDTFTPRAEPGQQDPFTFIFVGRLTPQKRLSLAFEAFRRFRDEAGQFGKTALSVVGDGPLRGELQSEAEKLGVADSVKWHGWVSRERLQQLYREADCLLQPSSIEGMSNTVLEGMASGLPVIVSEGPGNRDIVTDQQNGLVFPVDDVDALFAAMRTIRTDPSVARRLGSASREMAVARHSWVASARAYLELLGNHKPSPR